MALAFFLLAVFSLALLIFGLIKPTKVFLGNTVSRGTVAKVYGFAFPVFIIAFVIVIPKNETAKSEEATPPIAEANKIQAKVNETQHESRLYQFSNVYPGLSAEQVRAQGITVCRAREKTSNAMECRPKELTVVNNKIGTFPVSDFYVSFEPPYLIADKVVIVLGKKKVYNKLLPKSDPFYENDLSPSYDEVEEELSKMFGTVVSTRHSLTWHHGTKETVSYRKGEIEIYLSDYNTKDEYERAINERKKRIEAQGKESNAKENFVNSMK